eukprot:545880_1
MPKRNRRLQPKKVLTYNKDLFKDQKYYIKCGKNKFIKQMIKDVAKRGGSIKYQTNFGKSNKEKIHGILLLHGVTKVSKNVNEYAIKKKIQLYNINLIDHTIRKNKKINKKK